MFCLEEEKKQIDYSKEFEEYLRQMRADTTYNGVTFNNHEWEKELFGIKQAQN